MPGRTSYKRLVGPLGKRMLQMSPGYIIQSSECTGSPTPTAFCQEVSFTETGRPSTQIMRSLAQRGFVVSLVLNGFRALGRRIVPRTNVE